MASWRVSFCFVLSIFIFGISTAQAQSEIDTNTSRQRTIYTFFYNDVPGYFKAPLFGVINIARGSMVLI